MKSFTFFFAALLAILLLSFSSVSAQVLSNEIHYDNLGGDMNERIEVIGVAGTDLAGWSIVLYNGTGGAPYHTISLSGIIPNQCTVMGQNLGTLVFGPDLMVTGIQNGFPPDGEGWALVNNNNVVIEFLSYENTFTAVGGPANGMLSVDIVATEDGTGTADGSIQRQANNTWVTSLNINTFNDCNNSQIPLPVEFTEFTAISSPNGVLLTWTTSSETQNDYFSIERSGDGIQFHSIGEKDGNGTTAHGSDYTFTDEQPLNGNNYYRLKQVDEDDASSYSPVRVVRFGKAEPIAVYPNPTSSGNFNIRYTAPSEGSVHVSLKNAAGVEVTGQIVNVYRGDNFIPVSNVNSPDGPYWIVITTESQTSVVPVQVKTN